MAKINLDKYYTDTNLAKYCIEKTKEIIGENNITECLEPSAGNGSFSLQIKDCLAYDIEPEHESIIKQNFLELDLPYKEGRLIIGNPPFGEKNTLSVKFYKKSILLGDYISFILPVSQFNNNIQLYDFDLIHSEVLPKIEYSGVKLQCCLNIYKRPKKGLNKKQKITLSSIKIIEYRRGQKNKEIPLNFDFSMGTFGAGCVGREPKYIGNFALECYFYINEEVKNKVLSVLENTDWKIMSKGISGTYRLPQWKIYKYLKEQIPELE